MVCDDQLPVNEHIREGISARKTTNSPGVSTGVTHQGDTRARDVNPFMRLGIVVKDLEQPYVKAVRMTQ